MEDLISIYVGAIFFSVGRLLVGALATVHVFACIYWRIKVISCACVYLLASAHAHPS